MDVEHMWNVGLVVLTLLTVVLVISTLIIIACLKRENRMFHKRLAKNKTKQSEPENLEKLVVLIEQYCCNSDTERIKNTLR